MALPSGLTCLRCGTDYPAEEIVVGCAQCRAEGFAVNLRPNYPASAFRHVQEARGFDPEERGVWRYHQLLPASLSHAIWLGEGETPLIHLKYRCTCGSRLTDWVVTSRYGGRTAWNHDGEA